MRYLITLTPLEPFFFGGDITFGELGNENNSSYLVHSRHFPQQTALLGMLRKEILIQKGFLTKKTRGEWVEKGLKSEAKTFVGEAKFQFDKKQEFGILESISPVFLMQNNQKFIKKVAIDTLTYEDKLLKGYKPKKNIYDNFTALDNVKNLKTEEIFEARKQIGNAKFDSENSLYKKTSYSLKNNFKFAFYIECKEALKDDFITLGGDKSSFKMEVKESNEKLEYQDKQHYLTLLSDAYITVDLKTNCEFAITSEISFKYLENEFNKNKRKFSKSKNIFLYEKGSVFIEPEQALLDNLNNENLQKIGLNHYAYQKEANK